MFETGPGSGLSKLNGKDQTELDLQTPAGSIHEKFDTMFNGQ
jgi:hypothetical protein